LKTWSPGSAAVAVGAAALLVLWGAAAETEPAARISGFDLMSRENQAMQRDDMANPGMLWVQDGADLWAARAGGAGKSCADCHGDATVSMLGVAARYPAWDNEAGGPIDLQGRVNQCRKTHQGERPFAFESRELLALTAYVANESRGEAIAPSNDPRLTPARERGGELFRRRIGQLNLSCAVCHDDNAGRRLGSAPIPQAHPTGYPLYRLEWQSLGSLQRRFRNCMTGVRAEPYEPGAPEYVDLELYLMSRAAGLPVETPAVRP
jgi:sulfur-oxidizing protein SoxA